MDSIVTSDSDITVYDDSETEIETPSESEELVAPEEPEEVETDVDEPLIEPKYVFTDATKRFAGTTLHRIVAVKDFGNIKAGHLGGWIEKETNLTHSGACWVYDDAIVMGDACIHDDAQIRGCAVVSDTADVGRRAKVLDQAHICDDVLVTDNALIRDFSVVCGNSVIKGHSQVLNNGFVRDAVVNDHVSITDNAVVIGATLCNHAYICDNAVVDADIYLSGYTRLNLGSTLVQTNNGSQNVSFVRCALLGVGTDEPYEIRADENDPNLFHVDVYPDEPLRIIPKLLDPSSQCRISYVDVDITDEPVQSWPEDFIGQQDTVTLTVTNSLFGDYERRYTLQVNVVEKPNDSDVSDEEISLEIGGILAGFEDRLAETTEFPAVYRYTGAVGEEFKFKPVLVDERAKWRLEWNGIDVTDMPLRPVGQITNSELILTVTDPDDQANYRFYIILLTVTEPPRVNLDIEGFDLGAEHATAKRQSDSTTVYNVHGSTSEPFYLKPILADNRAVWTITWTGEDVSDAPMRIPFPVEKEFFIVTVSDPYKPSRKREYSVYVTLE